MGKSKPAKKKGAKSKPAPKKAMKPNKKSAKKQTSAKKPVAKKASTKKIVSKKPTVKVAAPVVKSQPKLSVDFSKAVTPLADRVLVRLTTAERVTPGGLIIPDNVSTVQGHLKGHVLAVGTGVRSKKGFKRPLDVMIGDQIYFSERASTKISFNGEDLHIVRESDVLGVTK